MVTEPQPVQWRCSRCAWTYSQQREICDDPSATGAGVGFVCEGKVTPCVWQQPTEQAQHEKGKFRQHERSCPAYGNYQPPYEECDCGVEGMSQHEATARLLERVIAEAEHHPCDSDLKMCRENWPADPASWCVGCLLAALTAATAQQAERAAEAERKIAIIIRDYDAAEKALREQQAEEIARLKALLSSECTCRLIEKCERCEAIDSALSKGTRT